MACQAWEGKITEDKEDLNIRLIHSRFPRVTMKTNERKVLVTLTLLDLCFLGLDISVGRYCLYRYLKEQAELPKHNYPPRRTGAKSENRAKATRRVNRKNEPIKGPFRCA